MKVSLKPRRQAMLQLHLSDQQVNCLLRCDLYWRFEGSTFMTPYLLITCACEYYHKVFHTNGCNVCNQKHLGIHNKTHASYTVRQNTAISNDPTSIYINLYRISFSKTKYIYIYIYIHSFMFQIYPKWDFWKYIHWPLQLTQKETM